MNAKVNKSKQKKELIAMSSEYELKKENVKNAYNLYTSEFSALTPDNIKYYLENARKGVNFWKSLLFEEIRRRDLRVGAVCQTRKLGVANKEWEVEYPEASKLGQTDQETNIAFVKKNFEQIDFTNLITDIVEAQIQGVSTFEILYKVYGSMVCLKEVCYIPNHLLLYDDLSDMYAFLDYQDADVSKLRTMGVTSSDRIDLSRLKKLELDDSKRIEVHSFDGNAQNGFMNGCIDSLIWAYLFKNYGLKDWAIYIERFATPAVIGKYPPLMNKVDRANFFEAVRNFGNNYSATIPDSAAIELLKDLGQASSANLFERYVNYWDKNISIRVLGQSLTTDIGNVGSKAASQTHDQVRHDIIVADMLLVKKTINNIIRKIFDLNFESVREYPVFKFKEEKNVEYKLKQSRVIQNLNSAGWRVTKDEIENEFGFEVEASASGNADNSGQQYINKFIEEFEDGLYK